MKLLHAHELFTYSFIQLSNALSWNIQCMVKLSWKNEHFAPKHITCVMMDFTFLVMNTEYARPTAVGQTVHPSVDVSNVLKYYTLFHVM